MKYYSFDRETGAYVGSGEADECQIEPGVFHLPAWATYDEPPVQEGMTAYFLSGSWKLSPVEQSSVVLAKQGTEMPPDRKYSHMLDLASSGISTVAKRLGFRDETDALSWVGEDSQRGYNADAFKQWRSQVMERVDILVARHINSHGPLPTHHEWNDIFAVQMERKIIPPEPVVTGKIQTHEEYALLVAAKEIEALIAARK